MPRTRVTFANKAGQQLAGVLETSDSPAQAHAIFTHCFTCGKDLKSIVRISRNLAQQGIAVLRFDFTGIGESEGDFVQTNFDTNVADLQAAIEWMNGRGTTADILIGSSLGGAAALSLLGRHPIAAASLGIQVLVTLASPSDTHHLADTLERLNPDLKTAERAEVVIGGRKWTATRQLTDNLRQHDLATEIRNLSLPHLILHSDADETVEFAHAQKLFELTGGNKQLIRLDGADHILAQRPGDIETVTQHIVEWCQKLT